MPDQRQDPAAKGKMANNTKPLSYPGEGLCQNVKAFGMDLAYGNDPSNARMLNPAPVWRSNDSGQ